MNINSFLVTPNITILEAMEVINKNAKGVVFVCEEKRFWGVVTDGDIRRYIIKYHDLSAPVLNVTNQNTIWLESAGEEQAMQIMRNKSISAIPILNSKKELVKICFCGGEVAEKESRKDLLGASLVIMAGGKGTRLKPYTDILPKPLIPIGDKTITEHIVDRFIDSGCSEIFMIVNYKKEFIKAYFHDSCYKETIKFVDEKVFLGTGGGLKLMEGGVDSTFFMSNCDILVNADYADILDYHCRESNLITMVCARKEFSIPYGTIKVNENRRVIELVEKPSNSYLVNTGFYVVEPELLSMIPKDTYIHITEIIETCIKENGKVGTYIINDEEWMDMGQFDEMEKMKQKLNIL